MLDKIGGAIGGYFGGPAGAAIGSAAGGFLSDAGSAYGEARQAEMTRDFNAYQASLSRESQIELANTQYQRMVKDLNAAGLSPMLAYSKTPTMPSAVTAASGATAGGPKLGESEQRSAGAALARQQIEVAESQKQVNIQTAKKVAAEAQLAAQRVLQEPARFYLEQAESGSRIGANSASTIKTDIDAANNANLVTPGSDPYWYRDLKKGFGKGKDAIDNFIYETYRKFRGK